MKSMPGEAHGIESDPNENRNGETEWEPKNVQVVPLPEGIVDCMRVVCSRETNQSSAEPTASSPARPTRTTELLSATNLLPADLLLLLLLELLLALEFPEDCEEELVVVVANLVLMSVTKSLVSEVSAENIL